MPLSDVALRKAKSADKPYRMTDGDGLYVIVQTTGSKWWRFDYSVNDRRKTLSLGTYPDVPLLDARTRRDEARKLVAKGVDPSLHRKKQKEVRKKEVEDTFGSVARDYIGKLRERGLSESTIKVNEWALHNKAAALARIPIREVTAHDILDILTKLEAGGLRDTAHCVRGAISAVYRFGISNLRAEYDPTYPLRGALLPVEVKPQAAITDERKFGRLLRSLDEYHGWVTMCAALQIMALCYPRPAELRKAEWDHFDLENRVWTVPKHLAKMRRPHDIPLSRQAFAIIEGLKPITGSSTYVFPSLRAGGNPLSEKAMNSALRRMGYTKDEHCSHGFRASASSILNARKFHPDVIERSLAHVDPNRVRRAYNRYEYWDERVELAQAWADICDDLKRPRRRNDDLI